jgi:RluA family pseudouridine synthase
LSKRFRVSPGDGATVAEVLARMGADDAAVAEGRVFHGRRRVRHGSESVAEGAVLEVAAPHTAPRAVRVVMQEDDLVAVDKPAGMPTIADHGGASHSLVHVAAKTLGIDASRLHPTSRLDRDVSGVVVFALTKEAAERLTRARSTGTYERRYVALATKAPQPSAGTWDAPLGRARDPRLRMVRGRDAIAASTRYAVCSASPAGVAMLGVAPITGRTHQIRVHASHAGAPLVGDRDYGGPTRVTLPTGRVLEPRRVALHARRVVVPGASGAPIRIEAAIPPELEALWSALGGDPAAWDLAAACDPGAPETR